MTTYIDSGLNQRSWAWRPYTLTIPPDPLLLSKEFREEGSGLRSVTWAFGVSKGLRFFLVRGFYEKFCWTAQLLCLYSVATMPLLLWLHRPSSCSWPGWPPQFTTEDDDCWNSVVVTHLGPLQLLSAISSVTLTHAKWIQLAHLAKRAVLFYIAILPKNVHWILFFFRDLHFGIVTTTNINSFSLGRKNELSRWFPRAWYLPVVNPNKPGEKWDSSGTVQHDPLVFPWILPC